MNITIRKSRQKDVLFGLLRWSFKQTEMSILCVQFILHYFRHIMYIYIKCITKLPINDTIAWEWIAPVHLYLLLNIIRKDNSAEFFSDLRCNHEKLEFKIVHKWLCELMITKI